MALFMPTTNMSTSVHEKGNLRDTIAGSSISSQADYRNDPPIASDRRGSSSDLRSVVPSSSSSSSILNSSSWARRAAPQDSSLEGSERTRSQLLRSVSHLHIDAQQLEIATTDADSPTSTNPAPFNRFDLIPPPDYRAKGSNRSRDSGRLRGFSFSEDRRDATSSTSDMATSSTYNTSTPNASQPSLSLPPKLAAQGKAKAAAAAAKIRKQLSYSKLSTTGETQKARAPSTSGLDLVTEASLTMPPSILNLPNLSSSRPLRTVGAENERSSPQNSPTADQGRSREEEEQSSTALTQRDNDSSIGNSTSSSSMQDGMTTGEPGQPSSTTSLGTSESDVPRSGFNFDQIALISTNQTLGNPQLLAADSIAASTPPSQKQQQHLESNAALYRHGDTPPDKVLGQVSTSSSSSIYRAAPGTAPIPVAGALQSPGRDSRVSFDCSQRAQLGSSETGPYQTSSRRPSLPFRTAVAEESDDMTDIDRRNISSFRRGSAPSEGYPKVKSTFRQGLMRLTGSTVDLNRFEANNGTRHGAHLERGGEAYEDEITASPLTPSDSPTRSRFSFSTQRRRPSQEAVSKPTSTFSLLSKFNKSRETLDVTTVDVDTDELAAPETGKGRKSSDASMTTRQFILKALRRPRRPSVPALNLAARPAMQASEVTEEDRSRSVAPSSETADTVFATAFGSPQKSDARSAEAFESARSLMSGMESTSNNDLLNGQTSRNRSSSRRASQDSASTSFFSIAESSSHPDLISRPPSRFLSPFGSIRSHARGNEHGSPHSLAQRVAPETPNEEEGPLGEQRQEGLLSKEAAVEQQRPFSDSYSTSEEVMSPPPTSLLPGASTSVSPSEQGSFFSRSTAASSMPPSDSMTTALHRELDPEYTSAKSDSRNNRNGELSIAGQEGTRIEGDGVAGQQSSSAEDSQGTNNNRSSGSTGNGNNRRTGRSSRLLHLPRLNSMNVFSGTSGGANGGGEDGNGGDDQRRHREESMGAEEHSSDAESGDGDTTTHEDEESETDSGSETEVSIDSEAETSIVPGSMPMASPASIAAPRHSIDDSGGVARPRPAGIALPPNPLFISSSATTSSPDQEQDIFTDSVVGRDAWQQFSSNATPSETPGLFTTPRPLTATTASQRMTPVSGSSRTPRAPAIGADNSYFDLRPTPARAGVDNQDMPPPSPSIITRSRATSSSSRRSTLSSTLRDLPPVPLMTPQTLRGLDIVPSRQRSPSRSTSTTSPIKRDSLPPLPSYRSATPALLNSQNRPISSSSALDRGTEAGSSRLTPMTAHAQSPLSPLSHNAKTTGRPTLYQQQSRSLIDLSATKKVKEPMRLPPPMSSVQQQQQKDQFSSALETGLLTPTGASTPGGLRRRRSMFEVGAQPPPYAVIHARPEGPQTILPREEEGKEALPRYTCSIHIEGYLPRKMEFSSPGLQAKDRSWRRQYFVLHGTCLKVYKTDLSGDNLLSKGAWGEVDGVHVHKEPMNEDGPVAPLLNGGVHPKEGSSSASMNQGHSHSHSIGNTSTGSGFNAAVEAVSAFKGSIYNGGKSSLIKTYSLQGAESGLAADYLKRRHVVRVRVEGEQFLLQTRNDRHVVDWIEAFQAATNVSLDLERRPMPKFITLPRRRRRRRREGVAEPAAGDNLSREEAEFREAQRRSIADAQSGGVNARRSMNGTSQNPARPLGLPGDESPIPSAAFDDMLREEHDAMMRQDAADM